MSETLFCLPYAGGGASFYRAWSPPEDMGFVLYPVQLPGREELFLQECYANVDQAVTDIVERIVRTVGPDDRISLFGHCFGAVLAFEVAHRLSKYPNYPLAHLFVSGASDPLTPLGRDSSALDDDEFVARVEQLTGYTHPALADRELRDMVLPALRADVMLHESYLARDLVPLSVPVTVVRGENDQLVSRSQCQGWAEVTSGRCEVVELKGGHMYLAESPAPLFDVLRRVARATTADTVGRGV